MAATAPASAPATPIALWQQLQASARLLREVRAGRSLATLLPGVPAHLRPAVQAQIFHVLRWLGTAQAVRRQLARQAPAPAVDALLCTALALLLPAGQQAYEGFTLVNQSVEAAKRDPATRRSAGFVNACLRRFLGQTAALLAQAEATDEGRWNHPAWWVRQLRQDHPAHWQAILQAGQYAAPMDLRVNPLHSSAAAYLQHLHAANLPAKALGGNAIRLHKAVPVSALPGFAQGMVTVQSATAQKAAPLLLGAGLPTGARVLDACAAPGGKTGHLLELCPQAEVLALDIDAQRSARTQDTLARLQLRAKVQVADAGQVADWWDGRPFDAILLDAPCSASGIVSRHPDVRWLRRASDIAQLASEQDRLLHALWPLLKPGGRLLYCTCSVFAQEGRARIAAFTRAHADAMPLPSPGHILPTPDTADAARLVLDDGFFYALLQKTAPPAA